MVFNFVSSAQRQPSQNTGQSFDIQELVNRALKLPDYSEESGSRLEETATYSSTQTTIDAVIDLERYSQYQGYQAFEATPIFALASGGQTSESEIEMIIRAIYRQVLGNAYVMESERLVSPESQLRHGNISVREFVRILAKSELYRSRFFTSCYRYRAIELNFKHLLGRAPDSYQEMMHHSHILDSQGYEADIDSYLDGGEYQTHFGENTVPYYRYKTRNGQSLLGFTNIFNLLTGVSGSDKDLTFGNTPKVMSAIMRAQSYSAAQGNNARSLVDEAVKPKLFASSGSTRGVSANDNIQEQLRRQCNEQSEKIAQLESRLADMRPLANFDLSFSVDSSRLSTQVRSADAASSSTDAIVAMFPGKKTDELEQVVVRQTKRIEQLEAQIAEAVPLSSLNEYRLGKWRKRSF